MSFDTFPKYSYELWSGLAQDGDFIDAPRGLSRAKAARDAKSICEGFSGPRRDSDAVVFNRYENEDSPGKPVLAFACCHQWGKPQKAPFANGDPTSRPVSVRPPPNRSGPWNPPESACKRRR